MRRIKNMCSNQEKRRRKVQSTAEAGTPFRAHVCAVPSSPHQRWGNKAWPLKWASTLCYRHEVEPVCQCHSRRAGRIPHGHGDERAGIGRW